MLVVSTLAIMEGHVNAGVGKLSVTNHSELGASPASQNARMTATCRASSVLAFPPVIYPLMRAVRRCITLSAIARNVFLSIDSPLPQRLPAQSESLESKSAERCRASTAIIPCTSVSKELTNELKTLAGDIQS